MTTGSAKCLRVGIAGYGVVGKRRRQCIDQHPELQTVAVCDKHFDGRGTLPDGVRYYAAYRDLLEEGLDILFVSLPNYMAAEVSIAGLEHGLHVFCEKPPASTVAEIEEVIRVERAHSGQFLKYGFNHRYHDSVREALGHVQSGELGEIVNVRGVYGKSRVVPFSGGWRAERASAGGGILLDQGVHMLDLMRLFCGDFTEVKSFVSNNFWRHDVEDNAYALMKDTEGRVAMLHSSATQWQHRFSMELALSNGYLELRGILSGSKSYGQEQLLVGKREDAAATGSTTETVVTYLDDTSWSDEVGEFADAIFGRGDILAGRSEDALAVMQLVNRIYWEDEQWRTAYQIPPS
jgi:predicted dehydrogenase